MAFGQVDELRRILHDDGEPGIVFVRDGRPRSVTVLELDADRITGIRLVLAPAKLGALLR